MFILLYILPPCYHHFFERVLSLLSMESIQSHSNRVPDPDKITPRGTLARPSTPPLYTGHTTDFLIPTLPYGGGSAV